MPASAGEVGVVSVHQGPGLTNTITGLTEAAKSRTPVLVLAGETPAAALTSNFRIDQHDLVESAVGPIADRVHAPRPQPTTRSARTTGDHRAPAGRADAANRHPASRRSRAHPRRSRAGGGGATAAGPVGGGDRDGRRHADRRAGGPLILAGRGAVLADARRTARALGERIGAVLATSAPANGLFAGLPYALGISGGFASPFARRAAPAADVVLVVGASANQWTTRARRAALRSRARGSDRHRARRDRRATARPTTHWSPTPASPRGR